MSSPVSHSRPGCRLLLRHAESPLSPLQRCIAEHERLLREARARKQALAALVAQTEGYLADLADAEAKQDVYLLSAKYSGHAA